MFQGSIFDETHAGSYNFGQDAENECVAWDDDEEEAAATQTNPVAPTPSFILGEDDKLLPLIGLRPFVILRTWNGPCCKKWEYGVDNW